MASWTSSPRRIRPVVLLSLIVRQIVLVQVSILGRIVADNVLAPEERGGDQLGLDVPWEGEAASGDADVPLPPLEFGVALQPSLQDVVDVRFAELTPTGQLAVQERDDPDPSRFHFF